jgi:hypothetical protein
MSAKGFAVMRVDRRGEQAPTYLRGFALAGRNGVRQYTFGLQACAHVFELQAEAEDIARRLRRRISATEHDYVVVEVAPQVTVPS